eukprot:1014616-Rhodomonas_salina.1
MLYLSIASTASPYTANQYCGPHSPQYGTVVLGLTAQYRTSHSAPVVGSKRSVPESARVG